jgi:uncharacterized protein (TIGR03086 family)
MEPLELYERASEWTANLVRGASDQLDAPTPCDDWNVRTLVSHIIDTQHYFAASARGEDAPLPNPNPPDLVGDDPAAAFDATRDDTLRAFREPADAEKAKMGVSIAFSDALLHGWDLATATGQDATMPDGLAEQAYEAIHGKFTDDQRKGIFKPEVAVPDDASPQEKLLAYSGRAPS